MGPAQEHLKSLSDSREKRANSDVLDGSGLAFSHVLDLRKAFQSDPHLAQQRLAEYYAPYSLAFADEAERSSLPRLHQSLLNPSSTLQVFAFMLGDGIAGGAHFKILRVGELTLSALEYVWVSPESRGRNLGRAICDTLDAFLSARGSICTVAEFHDPSLSSPESIEADAQAGITSKGRLQFWKKMGYQALDVPYICPPVVGQSVWNMDSLLGVKVLDEYRFQALATGPGYISVVRAYWDTFNSTYGSCQDYRRLVEQTEGLDRVELIPLDSPRRRKQHLS